MVKTPLPMQSEDEGYTSMANTLRRDPRQLRTMLLARRKDITSLLGDSKKRRDRENTAKLTAALGEIDEALAGLVIPAARRQAVLDAEAESLEGEESDEEEADDTDGDDLEKTNDEEEDADEVSAASEDEADAEDLDVDSGGEADVEEDVDVPEVDDAADMGDEPADEPAEEAAPTEPENPVAMNARLRKEVGDSAADFLDDYGQAIHKKVMSFFESLMTKALDLGEEDDSDGRSSLREILKEEVGKRGIRRIVPVFEEWRGVVIKQIAKDVADMFKPEEEEVPEDEAAAPEGQPEAQEPGAETAPTEPEEAAPEATEEAAAPAATVASAVAANNALLPPRATGRVSFAVRGTAGKATDFKPSGFTATRLD